MPVFGNQSNDTKEQEETSGGGTFNQKEFLAKKEKEAKEREAKK